MFFQTINNNFVRDPQYLDKVAGYKLVYSGKDNIFNITTNVKSMFRKVVDQYFHRIDLSSRVYNGNFGDSRKPLHNWTFGISGPVLRAGQNVEIGDLKDADGDAIIFYGVAPLTDNRFRQWAQFLLDDNFSISRSAIPNNQYYTFGAGGYTYFTHGNLRRQLRDFPSELLLLNRHKLGTTKRVVFKK